MFGVVALFSSLAISNCGKVAVMSYKPMIVALAEHFYVWSSFASATGRFPYVPHIAR